MDRNQKIRVEGKRGGEEREGANRLFETKKRGEL